MMVWKFGNLEIWKWVVLVSSIFYLILVSDGFAQNAYQGGSGDGYDMAEIQSVAIWRDADAEKHDLIMHPNPLAQHHQLHISWQKPLPEVRLYDACGKAITDFEIEISPEKLIITPGTLPAGSYFIGLQLDGAWYRGEIILIE